MLDGGGRGERRARATRMLSHGSKVANDCDIVAVTNISGVQQCRLCYEMEGVRT